MKFDWLSVGNLLAWIVAALVFYFNGQSMNASQIAVISERVTAVEVRIKQEVLGYQVMQSTVGERLDRIERKVDCLIDKRLCH